MERSATNVIGGLLEQRYRVGDLVARGGMSTVYRGVDTRLERPVAIKVMEPQFSADPAFVARFEREARAAAGLHHPGVVAVHDQGVDEDRVYLVMELVEGGTLRDLLTARGTLDVPLALTVLEKILSPLAAAHRADLVHRDIKPENVLIGRGGVVKVADFGLVRAVSGVGVTSDTTILGTVAYLSPEQVSTGSADARSDVYAAGIVLYEMLTGTPPYVGDNAISVAYRHVNDDVPPLLDVPPPVAELVRRATRREPFLRPKDAEAFLGEVEAARAELGIATVDVPVPGVQRPVAVEAGTVRVLQQAAPGAPSPAELTMPVLRTPTPAPVGPQGTRAISRAELAAPVAAPPAPPAPPRPRKKRPKKTPEQLHEEMRRKSKRQFVTWMSVVVVVGVLVGLGSWWMAVGRVSTVPDLVGKEEKVATALLDDVSLKSAITSQNSDTIPNGVVIGSEPKAGTEALHGDLVRLVVSRGKPVVPTVQAGVDVAAAQREIESVGLKAELNEGEAAFSDRVAKGKVVTLNPAPGTEVAIGSTVRIVISKGSQPKPVPNVAGKSKDEAFAALSAAGFDPVEGPAEFADGVENGKVVRTNPPAGTNVANGGDRKVTVTLSTSVTVPNVEGKRIKDAKKTLEDAGLQVEVQFNNRDRATVVNQSVRPGTKVAKGTKVVLIAL
ncbi:PASTA domain-containing protein [Actinosynnema sp. NPDC020468]|uniref:Stk1 family PASTA domain-containing Ser/Thr kinase n=1 Tax=Actinosynnema sp. NPDC020468 TaxID=3154488 RepID=UPI0033EE1F59